MSRSEMERFVRFLILFDFRYSSVRFPFDAATVTTQETPGRATGEL